MRRFRAIIKAAMFFVLAAALFAFLLVAYLYLSTPDPSNLKYENPNQTAFMEMSCGDLSNVDFVPLEGVSSFAIDATLLAEDPRFLYHSGVDWQNVWYAFLADIKHRDIVWGASSITMQLAKNLYLNPEKTFFRKLKQTILAYKLERELSKRRIFELYINYAEWGPCVYGIGEASEFYFEKKSGDIGPHEASFLATILPNPKVLGDGAISERFMDAGIGVFNELLRNHLPPVSDDDDQSCIQMFGDLDRMRIDYLTAKIFSNMAVDMESGNASLIARSELDEMLEPDEISFVDDLLEMAKGLSVEEEISCHRAFSGGDYTPVRQSDGWKNDKIYWVHKKATEGLSSLLKDAAQDDVWFKINSSYRASGYQIFLFISGLRADGYCLSKTLKRVALPEMSEHVCTDRQAIDFGSAKHAEALTEDSEEYRWLVKNASKYGFELSYPKNGDGKIDFEPWHWRHNLENR